jgi:hypothetical protein
VVGVESGSGAARPPAGWYPDPEAGGARWRWWDGAQWAAPETTYQWPWDDPAAEFERAVKFARWFRWAMVASALALAIVLGGVAFVFRDGVRLFSTDTQGSVSPSSQWQELQFLQYPLNGLFLAFTAMFVAWCAQIGKVAQLQQWPSRRNRVLGAFSILIPVVNLWWPYQAVRDAYPPGTAHPKLLRWWICYLTLPLLSALDVLVSVVTGSGLALAASFVVIVVFQIIVVTLGWSMTREVEAAQRSAVYATR